MVMAHGRTVKVTLMLDSGSTIKRMDTEFTLGQTAINLKVNGMRT